METTISIIHGEQTGSNHHQVGHPCQPPCSWRILAPRFPSKRDCLAAFIALEAAEVLAGAKPANLVRLSAEELPCGQNLCQLWRQHATELLRWSPLDATVLRETDDSILVLLSHPELMGKRLGGRGATVLLLRAGYPVPLTTDLALRHLVRRFKTTVFPHEIGLFLGYPLKDVVAFLGWKSLPFTHQRLWKIFGRPHRSLRLADHYRELRRQMGERLIATGQPLALLGGRP